MEQKSNWIWIPGWGGEDQDDARVVYFRKTLIFEEIPKDFCVRVSADSRYKLYVNGQLAEIGPCKGDLSIWYYDTVDLAPYLVQGENVLAAVVLRYPQDAAKGNDSIFRTSTPGFYMAGAVSADETWTCIRAKEICLHEEQAFLHPLYFLEEASCSQETFGWMKAGYDDSAWEPAKDLLWQIMAAREESPAKLTERPIPSMKREKRQFERAVTVRDSNLSLDQWNELLRGDGKIEIPSNSKEVVEIDAGELMTGFLRLSFENGGGAKVDILSSECYVYMDHSKPANPSGDPGSVKKGDRTDYRNGFLQGMTDTYRVAGLGNAKEPEIYEPFWFRTFRFVRLEITTREEPLIIQAFDYQETGYPLEVRTHVKTSDPTMDQIWDICERSLKRCMQETYMDCPFYEQLQYSMDTRSQILYTYAVAADDRLARKAIADFRRSQRYDGMIACCYPHTRFNAIPSFSIYYILMLHDHMMFFGDQKLIREYLPSVDAVLEFFHGHLDERGLVGQLGGRLFAGGAWSFIDWSPKWGDTSGVPHAAFLGPMTMDSLLYILGLEHAAELAAFAGRTGMEAEYQKRADSVRKAVRKNCVGAEGMICDGPGVEEYSQHCQVFSILTDVGDMEQNRINLLKTLRDKETYAQCTVAMAFYLFRALEKCGAYERTGELWDSWRKMVKENLTTCVENPDDPRSDCHAWGALALYELPAVVLGVRPTRPGFADMEIMPVPGPFAWAEGTVITPRGMVKVSWKKDADGFVRIEKTVKKE